MHPIRLLSAALLLLVLSAPAASASWRFGVEAWDLEVSGEAEDDSGRVDFAQLGLSSPTRVQWLLERRAASGSWWPDLALRHSGIEARGRQVVDTSITLGDLVLVPGESTAETEADFDDLALHLSYPLLGRDTRLSAGLAVKRLDGELVIREVESDNADRETVDQTFPLGLLAFYWPLHPRLQLGAEALYVEYRDDALYELQVQALVPLTRRLDLVAGWQRKDYRLRNREYRLDAEADGLRLGLSLRF